MKPLATSFQKNGPFGFPFALSDARVQARSRRVCRGLRALSTALQAPHPRQPRVRVGRVDRDENGVNALLGVSYSIDSGGTSWPAILRAHKPSLHDSQLFDLVTLPADIPPNRGA